SQSDSPGLYRAALRPRTTWEIASEPLEDQSRLPGRDALGAADVSHVLRDDQLVRTCLVWAGARHRRSVPGIRHALPGSGRIDFMRRYFGITTTVIIVIVVIIAMSAAGNIELDRPVENEFAPNRSSYNSGPTGTRALYQLLEESGMPAARWRESYSSLNAEAKDAMLVIVGPFQYGLKLTEEEAVALQGWIMRGGRALVISRSPIEQFGDGAPHSEAPERPPDWQAPPEQFIYEKSDELIVQPTELTRNVRGLALSGFASRMNFHPTERAERAKRGGPSDPAADPGATKDKVEENSPATLQAPVIHLGAKDGAALADFKYGEGRVIFLSDPFVVANNGIARGANLTLTLNVLRSMA